MTIYSLSWKVKEKSSFSYHVIRWYLFGSGKWRKRTTKIPRKEYNGESLYTVRANFQEGFIPRKLFPSYGTAYIPW